MIYGDLIARVILTIRRKKSKKKKLNQQLDHASCLDSSN